MDNIEKLYYNIDRLSDNRTDGEEVEKARDDVEKILGRETYFDCESEISILASASEKQEFIRGFRYAVSLLVCGMDPEAVRRAAECR